MKNAIVLGRSEDFKNASVRTGIAREFVSQGKPNSTVKDKASSAVSRSVQGRTMVESGLGCQRMV